MNLVAGFVVLSLVAAEPVTKSVKPNILFLLADDMRADAIAALGNPVIKTPNIDALVQRGFTFSNAYCMGANNGAVCTPSRNMILSGRSYFRFARLAEADRPNLPRSMKQAGYFTYHHGKKGNTATAIQALFDVNRYLANDDAARRSGFPGKIIADAAIEFLQSRRKDQPFCMYLAFEAPHDPRVADERYRRLYDPAKIPLPRNFLPEHPFDNGELKVRDEQLAGWPRTEQEIRKHLHDYYAVITGLDEQIGRIIATLQAQGELANTIVVFSSDHGLAVGSHGLMGKQNLYEHSMKSPLVFAGPGIPNGRSDTFCFLLDIFPTLCDFAEASMPAGLDGRSLAPVLRGQRKSIRDSVFLSYRDLQRAVRAGSWKLLYYPKIGRTQLFNLESDPDEIHDLSNEPTNTGRIGELFDLLATQQTQFGDNLKLPSTRGR